MPRLPRVCIVTPALAAANNGNWHTASRWARFLGTDVSDRAEVRVQLAWDGEPADALIALHARRSAESIERFRAAHPVGPLAVVMTGTDLYRDLQTDASAQHALECASHVVVLQAEGLAALPAGVRDRARCIVQSAARLRVSDGDGDGDGARDHVTMTAVGHLRDEKDPLTLLAALRQLPAHTPIRVVHIGSALDPALGAAATAAMRDCPVYRWLGGLDAPAARRWIARSRALVHMSRMEGGANVVIEAVRSGVPVLASRIDGNVGLLGADYRGYFPVGDAAALAALMQRFATDSAFADGLAAQCAAREPDFAPALEARRVRALLADMLGPRARAATDTIDRSTTRRNPAP